MMSFIGRTTAVLAIGLATISVTTAQPYSQRDQSETQRIPPQHLRPSDTLPIIPAVDIVGRRLVDPNGGDAGRVSSLIFDIKNGNVDFVLIEGRGNLDLDNKLVALPWSVFERPSERGAIQIKIQAKQLEQAPRIDRNLLYELNTPEWRSRV
jgi:sporulation protein YlmC with PRC-barrel domain